MKKEQIEQWARGDQLRKRSLDKEKVKSMIESSTMNMAIVKTVSLSRNKALFLFFEKPTSLYVSWAMLIGGYVDTNHEIMR